MDNMKKVEMDAVEENLLSYSVLSNVSENYTIIFRDSKAQRYELIQIADAISGTLRDYFEGETSNSVLSMFCYMCNNDNYCMTKHRYKHFKNLKISNKNMDIFKLHSSAITPATMLVHIIPIPFTKYAQFKYIDCKIKRS